VNSVKAPAQSAFAGNTSDIFGTFGTPKPSNALSTGSTQTSQVTFGAGSIAISFEGVVPSEAEAFRTGQTVGSGIADMLARRDAQLAVRVM
jgi:hypothetical protein